MKLVRKNGASGRQETTMSFKGLTLDRRSFLRNSGVMAGGAAAGTVLAPGMMRKSQAATKATGGDITTVRSVCTGADRSSSISAWCSGDSDMNESSRAESLGLNYILRVRPREHLYATQGFNNFSFSVYFLFDFRASGRKCVVNDNKDA